MTELTARLSAVPIEYEAVRHQSELADFDLVVLLPGPTGDLCSRLRDRAMRDGFLHVAARHQGGFDLLARATIDIDVIFLEPFLAEHALIADGHRVLDIGWQPLRPGDFASRDVRWVSLPPVPRVVRMLGEPRGEGERQPSPRLAGELPPDSVVAPGAAFDVVLCNALLDQVQDLHTALRTLRRLVTPDGVVVASVSHPLRAGACSGRTSAQHVLAFERSGFEVEKVTDTAESCRWIEGAVSCTPQLQIFRLRPEPAAGPKHGPACPGRPGGLP
ncbi:methyltransferase domain-containing protein [Streptomyces prunicolor]